MKYLGYRTIVDNEIKYLTKHHSVDFRGMDYLTKTEKIMRCLDLKAMEGEHSKQRYHFFSQVYHWARTGQKTLFLENKFLATSIMEGKYSSKSHEVLYSGDETFMLMLPSDLKINGMPVKSGVLVTIIHNKNWVRDYINPALEIIGVPQGKRNVEQDETMIDSKEYFHIHNDMDNGFKVVINASTTSYLTDERLLFDAFQGCSDYKEYGVKEENSKDMKVYADNILKLIAGVLIYKKALPDRIIKGMPKPKHKMRIDKQLKAASHSYLGSDATCDGSSKTMHHRTWYFRQLTHEKYYQGEHANEPIGSRMVFVSDTMVNSRDEVYTAIK